MSLKIVVRFLQYEINALKKALKEIEKVNVELNKSVQSLRKKLAEQRDEINELYDQQETTSSSTHGKTHWKFMEFQRTFTPQPRK